MANRRRFDINKLSFSDPPPQRERCFGDDPVNGKVIFEHEESARAEAERLRNDEGIRLDVYWCAHCFHWHFTKSRD